MLWLVLNILTLCAIRARAGLPMRVCVPQSLSEPCTAMAESLPDKFVCVEAVDKLHCIRKISSGEADLTMADPRAIFIGGKNHGLKPIATELVDGEPFRYKGIALVRKNSTIQGLLDLQGKNSCHTGVGRTVGWQIPIARIQMSPLLPQAPCSDSDLSTASKFFGQSCAPGNWSSDPVVDRELKSNYPQLCSKCKDPSLCSSNDEYAGYEGVMRCLSDGAGDVAFTKIPVLREYLQKNPSFADEAEILCLEGGRNSVLEQDPCTWGSRPTNAYITSSGKSPEEIDEFVNALLQTQARFAVPQVPRPEWYYKTFLSSEYVSGLRKTETDRNTYISYLGDFLYTIQKPTPACKLHARMNAAAFCVTSPEEQSRCGEYAEAAEARGLLPFIRCVSVVTKAACMQTLKEGNAELVVLDGGDVYKGGRYFDLLPIAGELYGQSDANYYAVAVLRSASDATKLSDLKDLRSCHTGIGRTAGWVMPVGALLSDGQLSEEEGCNRAAAVADFFSAGSCVPGANDTKYNPDRTRSEDLCRHCIGDEEGLHKCARDSRERYSGYAGALRCLAEGRGDVAFVKHTTVPDYTDGRSEATWARDLVSSDFALLCPDSQKTAPVKDYHGCNLGKVPSHYVMTKGGVSRNRRLELARLMADSSRWFGDDSDLFRLFHTHRGQYQDLLFKDSATALKVAPLESTYKEVLGTRFLEASKASDPKACSQ